MNAKCDIVMPNMSVRPSVCHTVVLYRNSKRMHIVELFLPSGRSMTVFLSISAVTKLQWRFSLSGGR